MENSKNDFYMKISPIFRENIIIKLKIPYENILRINLYDVSGRKQNLFNEKVKKRN